MKEIKYIEIDGLLYPDLQLQAQKEIYLSKYGRMRKQYLKEYCSSIYTNLIVSSDPNNYLEKFDDEMNNLYDRLIEQYKVKWNITEELKELNQMKWIREMDNIQNCVGEVVMHNVIYQ